MSNNHPERNGILFLTAAVLCFSSVPVMLKYFTAYLDAWTVNGIRYAVAMLFWLPFVIRRQRAGTGCGGVWRAAILPAAVNTVAQIGWALAPYHNDAAFIGFVCRSSFLFSTVFGFWLLPGERAVARRPLFWVGACGIGVGLLVMYGDGLQRQSTSPLGMAILLVTALCWGLYGVFVRRNLGRYDARLSFGVISLYTTAALWVAMFLFGDWRELGQVRSPLWVLLVVSAMLGITFSHVLLYRAIHALGPVVSEGGLAFAPFVTASVAALVLGEGLGAFGWMGGLILAASCVCLVSSKWRQRRRESAQAALVKAGY